MKKIYLTIYIFNNSSKKFILGEDYYYKKGNIIFHDFGSIKECKCFLLSMKFLAVIFTLVLSTNLALSAEKWDMALAYGASNFHSANFIARRIREIGVFSEIISHKKVKIGDIDHTVNGIL